MKTVYVSPRQPCLTRNRARTDGHSLIGSRNGLYGKTFREAIDGIAGDIGHIRTESAGETGKSVSDPPSAFPVSLCPTLCPISCPEELFPGAESFLSGELCGRLMDFIRDRGIFPDQVEEIRLHTDRLTTLTVGNRNILTPFCLSQKDMNDLLQRLCGGSLYACSDQINRGFLTLPSGVRVGVAGEVAAENGRILGLRTVRSLCLRLPHGHGPVGGEVCCILRRLMASGRAEGVLIYAPPGEGKTTLLRGVAGGMAGGEAALRTVIIDTRGELLFSLDSADLCLDVLTGYPRPVGVEVATRTLNAQLIICDEIGDMGETAALLSAHRGGVPLVATAHARDLSELLRRPAFRAMHRGALFGAYIGIQRDGKGGFTYQVTERREVDRINGNAGL